jgi:hypothetical protein
MSLKQSVRARISKSFMKRRVFVNAYEPGNELVKLSERGSCKYPRLLSLKRV